MPIVIPDEKFEEFLRSLLVGVTKIREELIAEAVADIEVFRAKMNAGYECKVREAIRRAEEEIERATRAVEEKLRAFEEGRLRQTAAAERGERPQ